MTVTIAVNGQQRSVQPGSTVTDLVAEITDRAIATDGHAVDGSRVGVAVARNAAVVSRSLWWSTAVTAGDEIEIVTAVQGG
ncbi:sulfur carrier protein ThiS [Cryobacterium sp. TMT1-2-2]|uniref:sulfur carrier protein ThiS n=1 Tax=Cryobacterium sp. TMT1-2-2 TaxID=1259233 RepID=UPI00106C7681|nr:sulfur carrier protein ThiS [Cryobacterium sp. TMT1-2-2]TFD13327.1 sulfur carrier protein ThiS [Cryobacterium sp. TMT1-2-2]